MKLGLLIAYSATVLAVGCNKNEKQTRRTYEVAFTDDKIVFRGIDQPHITTDLSGDEFVDSDRGGRINASMRKRVLAETAKATADLRMLLPSADTETLIRSIRHDYEGEACGIDFDIALEGNWIVGAELASRRPIPEELVPRPDPLEGHYRPFVGISGPPLGTFDEFLEYAKEIESRLRER